LKSLAGPFEQEQQNVEDRYQQEGLEEIKPYSYDNPFINKW